MQVQCHYQWANCYLIHTNKANPLVTRKNPMLRVLCLGQSPHHDLHQIHHPHHDHPLDHHRDLHGTHHACLHTQHSVHHSGWTKINGTALHRRPISELWNITCHMESLCFPTQVNVPHHNSSQTDQNSIYLPQRDERLSWPWCWLYTEMVYMSALHIPI